MVHVSQVTRHKCILSKSTMFNVASPDWNFSLDKDQEVHEGARRANTGPLAPACQRREMSTLASRSWQRGGLVPGARACSVQVQLRIGRRRFRSAQTCAREGSLAAAARCMQLALHKVAVKDARGVGSSSGLWRGPVGHVVLQCRKTARSPSSPIPPGLCSSLAIADFTRATTTERDVIFRRLQAR